MAEPNQGPVDAWGLPTDPNKGQYEQHRERAAKRERKKSQSGRDVGKLPPVVNPQRREDCRRNFRLFCETYFAGTFCIAWSEDHLRVIATIERVILEGGTLALAMPRGTGKTSLIIAATMWAISYGHRRFVAAIAATATDAEKMLDSIKAFVELEEPYGDDFPEVCFAVRALEGINNRAAGQLLEGERTRIKWTGQHLVFPTVANAASSGSVIRVAGITGAIRGMQSRAPDGSVIRPDLALLDDPQTDESAWSVTETAKRERTVKGSVMGLAGPGKKIAAFMSCTVVAPDDLAARFLDRALHPDWQGEKTKLLYELPTRLDLWTTYKDLRDESLRAGEGIKRATDFYAANREAMDAGARAAWLERFEPDQISAIQYAMDLRAKDESVFLAEYQNEPKRAEIEGIEALKASDVSARVTGVPRGIVPDWADLATAFIDVQQDVLFWMVVAWNREFRGHVVEYGAWPEQGRAYYTLSDLRVSLRDRYKADTVEHALLAGLQELSAAILGRSWNRQSASTQPIAVDQLLIDANWQASTELVYQVARTVGGGKLTPSHGRFIGSSSVPMEAWPVKDGDKPGHGWRVSLGRRRQRHVIVDVNMWKTVVAQRLRGPAEPNGIALFGEFPQEHQMLGDQLAAEYSILAEARGRKVNEWKLRPGRDNHWWDCIVGSAVAASIAGASIPGQVQLRRTKRISYAEAQAAKRSQR